MLGDGITPPHNEQALEPRRPDQKEKKEIYGRKSIIYTIQIYEEYIPALPMNLLKQSICICLKKGM